MKKECVNPKALFDSTNFGFSQVVISQPGKLVYISGQVAWNKDRKIKGIGDLQTQSQKSIENLKIAMKSIGGNLEDIVMLRIYIVNYTEEAGKIIGNALRNNFGTTNPPASTWINVKGLANEEFLIEIEAQAILSNGE